MASSEDLKKEVDQVLKGDINKEIKSLLDKNYEQCCDYLKEKYGHISEHYFKDSIKWVKNPKISRGGEGLYIHHIDEDKAIMLSSLESAKSNPWKYQRGPRLVYCNLLEHLILHIKIFQYPNPDKNPFEDVGSGGIYNFLVPELNDIYSGIDYNTPWKKKVTSLILPLKVEYLYCIKFLNDLGFEKPLYTTFLFNKDIWNISKNKDLFEQFKMLKIKE